MLHIHQSPLPPNILGLMRQGREKNTDADNVTDKYEHIISVPESSCALPWPLMGEIFQYAVTPIILRSSQKLLATLMLLDRKSLAEINRLLIINPVIRLGWIEAQMRRFNGRIRVLANKNKLHLADNQARLGKIQHISIDFSHIKQIYISKVLNYLSKKTNIKSLSIFAGGSFSKQPHILISAIISIINKNKDLNYIDNLSLQKNNLNAIHIEILAKALIGKKINLLALDENPIGEEGKEILFEHLKNMTVHDLRIDATELSGPYMPFLSAA